MDSCSENGLSCHISIYCLAIDDTHNTWTNMIVKMTILRLLGSSDDKEKEKIGIARPEGVKALRSVAPEEPTPGHQSIRW